MSVGTTTCHVSSREFSTFFPGDALHSYFVFNELRFLGSCFFQIFLTPPDFKNLHERFSRFNSGHTNQGEVIMSKVIQHSAAGTVAAREK